MMNTLQDIIEIGWKFIFYRVQRQGRHLMFFFTNFVQFFFGLIAASYPPHIKKLLYRNAISSICSPFFCISLKIIYRSGGVGGITVLGV